MAFLHSSEDKNMAIVGYPDNYRSDLFCRTGLLVTRSSDNKSITTCIKAYTAILQRACIHLNSQSCPAVYTALASVPRLSAWVAGAEKIEPGMHCTRMREM